MSKPFPPTQRPPGEPAGHEREQEHSPADDTLPSGVQVNVDAVAQLRAENAALRARLAAVEAELARASRGSDAPRPSQRGGAQGSDAPRSQRGGGRSSDAPRPSQRGAAYDATERRLGGSWQILLSILDSSPNFIFVKDREGRYVIVNRRLAELFGKTREEFFGLTDEDLFSPEVAEHMRTSDRPVLADGQAFQLEEKLSMPEGERIFLTLKFPLHDERGALSGLCGISTDITDTRREEAQRAALQEQLIAAQREALRELSTPLVPIADGVLAMPLVGSVDSLRAGQIMEALLEGIGARQAHTAILDITGVRVVDTAVANALMQAARAAGLLGARVVITGIRPEVAQTLVQIEADLGGIVTLSTLQSGIAHALASSRSARPARPSQR